MRNFMHWNDKSAYKEQGKGILQCIYGRQALISRKNTDRFVESAKSFKSKMKIKLCFLLSVITKVYSHLNNEIFGDGEFYGKWDTKVC